MLGYTALLVHCGHTSALPYCVRTVTTLLRCRTVSALWSHKRPDVLSYCGHNVAALLTAKLQYN